MSTKIVLRAALLLVITAMGVALYRYIRSGAAEIGLAVATAQTQPSNERIYSAGFDTVFQAVLSVLQDNKEPVALSDKSRGLINTGSVDANNQRLSQIVTQGVTPSSEQQTGRYLMTFQVEVVTPTTTRVRVTPLILSENPAMANPFGGRPLASNGTLEREHLDAIGRKIIG